MRAKKCTKTPLWMDPIGTTRRMWISCIQMIARIAFFRIRQGTAVPRDRGCSVMTFASSIPARACHAVVSSCRTSQSRATLQRGIWTSHFGKSCCAFPPWFCHFRHNPPTFTVHSQTVDASKQTQQPDPPHRQVKARSADYSICSRKLCGGDHLCRH